MSIFSTIGKVGKEIGSILSAGYTNPSKSGGKTSALSSMYDKYKSDLAKAKSAAGGLFGSTAHAAESSGGGGNSTNSNLSSFKGSLGNALGSSKTSSSKGVGGGGGSASKAAGSASAAASAADKARKAAEKAQQEAEDKIRNSINQGYDASGSEFDAASSALDTSNNYINNLGTTRDSYLGALDSYKNKTDAAIAGNKKLIEQNQKRDLGDLAGETRKSVDNTNIMLGIKGASGGSASKAAARAISASAGKQRAGILTSYGDEFSQQNQAAENAKQEYNTKRKQAYEWETTSREQALDSYNEAKTALDMAKTSKTGYQTADTKALSDRNLQKLLMSLTTIQAQARAFRDNLAAKMTDYGAGTDALNVANVNVDAPAELDTPVFDENIDLNNPNNAEDWYDPTKSGKRIVVGKNALGQSVDENGNVIEVDENGNPIAA